MSAPLPLALWAAALLVGVLALRARPRASGAASGNRSDALPAWIRLAARIPAPAPLRRLAGRLPGSAPAAAAGLGPGQAEVVTRAAAGGAVGGLLLGTGAVALSAPAVLLAPVLAAAGALAPVRWRLGRARRRRAAIVRELPDLLDLLAICVEAGMALDPALATTARRLGGVLGAEVQLTLRELALGTPRREAYRELAARSATTELAQVVGALLQAEELGAPLSAALAGQAGGMRAARRQQARDRAAKAAPKIQLVVALLMVPGALMLVLGVMLIELARQVGAVTGGG